ncbi:hypothetical protein QTP88_027954 [Uroleucon formosanum]
MASNIDGEFSDDESSDSMPSLSLTDDEPNVKKSNELKSGIQQKKITISKDPEWSPLKCSVVESSHAHITSTPVIAHSNHSNKTPLTTKTAVSPQMIVDSYNSCLNSNIIGKGDSSHLSFANKSLFTDLDKSQNIGLINSPIKISTRTLSDNNCSMEYNIMGGPSTSNEQTVQKVENCVIIKKTIENKSSNLKQQKSLHKDDQYAKLLNFMVTIKYEIRSMQEKLDIMTQQDEENNTAKSKDLSIYDTSDIDNKLPIKTQEQLEELENDLSNNKNYRCQMVKHLSSVDSVLAIKKFAMADNASNVIEQVVKYVLIQTPFKINDKARKKFV